jgi:hypothetical protein
MYLCLTALLLSSYNLNILVPKDPAVGKHLVQSMSLPVLLRPPKSQQSKTAAPFAYDAEYCFNQSSHSGLSRTSKQMSVMTINSGRTQCKTDDGTAIALDLQCDAASARRSGVQSTVLVLSTSSELIKGIYHQSLGTFSTFSIALSILENATALAALTRGHITSGSGIKHMVLWGGRDWTQYVPSLITRIRTAILTLMFSRHMLTVEWVPTDDKFAPFPGSVWLFPRTLFDEGGPFLFGDPSTARRVVATCDVRHAT